MDTISVQIGKKLVASVNIDENLNENENLNEECENVTSLIDLNDDVIEENPFQNKIDVQQLLDSLKCSICKETFNEPVTLLCNHTF